MFTVKTKKDKISTYIYIMIHCLSLLGLRFKCLYNHTNMLLKLPYNFYCKEGIIIVLLKINWSTVNNKKKNESNNWQCVWKTSENPNKSIKTKRIYLSLDNIFNSLNLYCISNKYT